MKIGAIIQARMSSSRLSNKVLMPLPYNSDVCVLQQVIRRVSNSKLINQVIVATSNHAEDEQIVDIANLENVSYFRGSLDNVLDRFYKTAVKFDLDCIVRVTSDNPCIDSSILDRVIENHLEVGADYTSTSLINRFPVGIGCEVINFDALEKAHLNASENYEKEHVTPFIYKTNPKDFNINCYYGKEDYSDLRITLDTSQDYALLCSIYDNLYEKNNFFNLNDILFLFNEKPWLRFINEDILQKKICSNLSEELEEAIHLCDMQDLDKASEFIKNHFG